MNVTTIGAKIVDTFTFLTPYFVTVTRFYSPSLSFQPPSPQTMLYGNCRYLEVQTSNSWMGERGLFYSLMREKKSEKKTTVCTTHHLFSKKEGAEI